MTLQTRQGKLHLAATNAFLTGENTRFPQVKVAESPNARPLKALAAFCWVELTHYADQLRDADGEDYAAFCRGAIKANERLLTEMERIEAAALPKEREA